jgi:hypothetical protein
MSTTSFGKWYSETKAGDSDDNDNPEDHGMILPLFHTDRFTLPSGASAWRNLKSALENQMPQQVLGMNYQQRFQVFCALIIASALFFALAFFVGMPMITVRPQKFALSFTCGSLTFMGSFVVLRGPVAHFSGLISMERLPFTSLYFASMLGTLYSTFTFRGAKGYIIVLAFSVLQILSLLWYLVTFLPGGSQGLQFLALAIGKMLRPMLTMCKSCISSIIRMCAGS